ncbi:MAG: NADH-quinone oxidoreductase subunit A [Nitrospirae bacterium]|nr:NADH-quinone oxidoreductase subunit A [Nitrospirota bacterium]MCL5238212.1 NADH-quinone oxidoreductase subunit A [Nitrospirota bacterium]
MNTPSAYTTALWPLAVYFVAVVLMVASMMVFSYFLGQRHKERLTGEPYESGMPVTGSARLRFDIKFYLIAMFFVIFDLESVFIFAWAVAAREIGWAGYIEALIFIGILTAALVYLWKLGALDWGTPGRLRRGIRFTVERDSL